MPGNMDDVKNRKFTYALLQAERFDPTDRT